MISANGGLPAHSYTPQVTPRWPRGSEPASHGYNLLFKDLCALPTVKDVITKCRTVLSFFRDRFRASGILKDEQKKHKEKDAQQDMTEPPLPGDTRFATNYPCIKFMVKNKGPLQSSVVSPD